MRSLPRGVQLAFYVLHVLIFLELAATCKVRKPWRCVPRYIVCTCQLYTCMAYQLWCLPRALALVFIFGDVLYEERVYLYIRVRPECVCRRQALRTYLHSICCSTDR